MKAAATAAAWGPRPPDLGPDLEYPTYTEEYEEEMKKRRDEGGGGGTYR